MNYVRLLPTPDLGMALLIRKEATPNTPWMQIAYHKNIVAAKQLAIQAEHEKEFRVALITLAEKAPYPFPPNMRPVSWPVYNG